MKPSHIFDSPAIELGNLDLMVNNSCMWPLIKEEANWYSSEIAGLAVKVHGRVIVDYRRFYAVLSVWWHDECVAIGRMAGREGDDAYDVKIINAPSHEEMAEQINAAVAVKDTPSISDEAVGADAEIGDFCTWYGETVTLGVESQHDRY